MAERLDNVVAAQATVSRSQARSLIMEGRVKVNGARATKPGANVNPNSFIEIERPRRFVSRGGEKLQHALDAFGIDVTGKTALDVGASTGGFTDCLLQRGAAHVVAVDVGYGQLDWRLRNDRRVTVIERTNFRNLPDDAFERDFDVIVIDASFISLRTILSRAVAYLQTAGDIVALVKPQFEAGRARIGGGGVVRDARVHQEVLHELRAAAVHLGLIPVNVIESPLRGPAGNREFLMHLRRSGAPVSDEVIHGVACEGGPV
jgi:23S rRNA (cytidine1920-2'-O)/16S rRNA (cytidine1409-2'-O)-methyltransferase